MELVISKLRESPVSPGWQPGTTEVTAGECVDQGYKHMHIKRCFSHAKYWYDHDPDHIMQTRGMDGKLIEEWMKQTGRSKTEADKLMDNMCFWSDSPVNGTANAETIMMKK